MFALKLKQLSMPFYQSSLIHSLSSTKPTLDTPGGEEACAKLTSQYLQDDIQEGHLEGASTNDHKHKHIRVLVQAQKTFSDTTLEGLVNSVCYELKLRAIGSSSSICLLHLASRRSYGEVDSLSSSGKYHCNSWCRRRRPACH